MPATKKKSKKKKSQSQKKKAPRAEKKAAIATSIVPWLNLRGGARAVDFYKSAFGAVEIFRIGDADSTVARLSIGGAEFWLSDESPEHLNVCPKPAEGATVRIILTVNDPDAVFARAIKAGAKEVYPVADDHGWRIGRISDPFGHHWEIAKPLA
jgi:PhnB protein